MEESAIEYISKLEDIIEQLMDNAQVKQEEVDELMDELDDCHEALAMLEKEFYMSHGGNHTPYFPPKIKKAH